MNKRPGALRFIKHDGTEIGDFRPNRDNPVGLHFLVQQRGLKLGEVISSKLFHTACEIGKVLPTTRQAHKWMRRDGEAWNHRQAACERLGLGLAVIREPLQEFLK